MTISNESSVLGFTNDTYDTTPRFTTGKVVVANGTDYIYALAASAIAAAGTTNLTGAFGAVTTTAGSTYTHDVTGAGVPISTYFWAKKVASPF